MTWHFFSLPLIVVCVLIYHVVQKNMPKEANPLAVVASAYLLGAAACILLLLVLDEWKKGSELLRTQNWLLTALLGMSAVGVELGFIYAYRTGWNISTMSVTVGSFTTVSLAVIGVLWFKESLSAVNIAGIVLCIAGFLLVNWK